ncbi:hypothetical protein ACFL1I_08620 [Candidatus Omnitrophota bacterium]
MEKKRPLGIMILVIGGIFFEILQFLREVTNIESFDIFAILDISLFLGFLFALYSLFMLKNWARKFLLIFNYIGVFLFLAYLTMSILIVFVGKYEQASPETIFSKFVELNMLGKIHWILGVAYLFSFIYYLTRPKVKEQFR